MIFKIFLIIIGIFLLIIYLAPLAETKLNLGNLFGAALGITLILIGITYNMLKNLLIFKIILIILAIGALLFLGVLGYIIHKSRCSAKNEKTVIVLGCRVKWDKPSLSLIERCRVAGEYLKENEDAIAILSGGKGKDEKISEAECMLNLLTEFGIDESRLYLENKSTSTDENIKFSKQIIERFNLSKNVAIATSEYHEARAGIIAKRYDLNASSLPCKTLSRVKAPFYTREVFGLIYEMIGNIIK